jgi:sterol carrier protein 2
VLSLLSLAPPSPQAFLLRKLKISGSMGVAMKLQPILDAAAPKSKM